MRLTALNILFFFSVAAIGQTHRIDSLKNIFPSQNGREAVNSLIALGNEYFFYWVHSDSAFKYSDLAYQKASEINYTSGKAAALLVHGGVEGRLLRHPDVMEEYALRAIAVLKNMDDPKTLSLAYVNLAAAYNLQGKYPEALSNALKAKELAEQSGDKRSIGWAQKTIGFVYFKNGEYWKDFDPLMQAHEIGLELNDSILISLSYVIIARSFNRANDPQKALSYYHAALPYAPPFILLFNQLEDMGYAHLLLKNYDSAIYYQRKHWQNLQIMTTDEQIRRKFSSGYWGYSIDIQIEKKQYDSVLAQLLPMLNDLRQTRKDVYPLMQCLLSIAKVYEGKKDYRAALHYCRELLQIARHTDNKSFLRDGTQLMASIFHDLDQNDSAYYYFKHYTVVNDSMATVEFAGRTALYLAASESENKIRLLEKDNEINAQQLALDRDELQKQSQLRKLLVTGLVILMLFSFIVFRNIILKRKNEKLRNEREQSALKRKATELEMQALRAQMNPHFIFNCLSAIDNLIQTRQADKATSYLNRFAKLIRSVLDSSKNNLVPFQKDLETIKLYLEMEQFRCNNKFLYEINVEPALLHGDFKVPPLLAQPFIENAIHHGLLNKKEGDRRVQVRIELSDEHLVYSIIDNGIGREKAKTLKEKNKPEHQSYGIAITRERIHLHNKNGIDDDFTITDLQQDGIATGTQAVIRINCSKS